MSDTPPPTERERLLADVRAYCESTGISLSTLGVRALANSRYFDRVERRIEREAEEAERLRAYMTANPPRAPADTEPPPAAADSPAAA